MWDKKSFIYIYIYSQEVNCVFSMWNNFFFEIVFIIYNNDAIVNHKMEEFRSRIYCFCYNKFTLLLFAVGASNTSTVIL
jgi:hypothetical protein